MKNYIYTVVAGDKYQTSEPIVIPSNDWKLICFTNNKDKPESNGWKVIYKENKVRFANTTWSRYPKIYPYDFFTKGWDVLVYIDSRMQINVDIDKLVKHFLGTKYDIAVMKHNRRICAYDEANYLIEKDIGNPIIIQGQMAKYLARGLPKDYGLYAPGIMLRKNTPFVRELMKEWWGEVLLGSYRDQISLPYVIWRMSKNYNIYEHMNLMPFDIIKKYFRKGN